MKNDEILYSKFFLNPNFTINRAKRRSIGVEWSNILSPKNDDHHQHRLYYIFDGEAELTLRSEKISLKKGYLYFIPAFSILETQCNQFMTQYFIHFQSSLPILELFENRSHSVIITNEAELLGDFQVIFDRYRNPDFQSQFLAQAYLRKIMARLLPSEPVSPQTSEINHAIDAAIQYITSHLKERISISDLCRELAYNPAYFSNEFRIRMGVTLKQYVLNQKLLLAQNLLKTTNLPIKEISNQLSFDSENYFCQIFKEKIGNTPSIYRKIYLLRIQKEKSAQ